VVVGGLWEAQRAEDVLDVLLDGVVGDEEGARRSPAAGGGAANAVIGNLGGKVADDLLSDKQYAGLAPGLLNGSWILWMVDSVEAIRAKGKLDVLALTAASWPRVQLVIALVRDPASFNSTTVLASMPNNGIPADQVKEVESRGGRVAPGRPRDDPVRDRP
jgi:hypothetical protein